MRPLPPISPSPYSVNGANRKPLRILGQTTLQIKAMGFSGEINALICSELSQNAILGMDAIRQMKLALNPISQEFFHVNDIELGQRGKIIKRVTLQPFEVRHIRIHVGEISSGNVLVTTEPSIMEEWNLVIPDAVIKMHDHHGQIIVKNCLPQTTVLERGMNICLVELIDQEVISVNKTELSKQLHSEDVNTPLPPPLAGHLQEQFWKKLNVSVPNDELFKYKQLFLRNHDVFSRDKNDLGRANNFEHTIRLKNNDPIYRKQFRIPEAHREALHRQIDDWLKIGIIEPCFSRYNSPIFIVPKKDGTFRFVLDYRTLNDNSLDDRYTMKDVGECIGEIGRAGSTIFSTMDLTSGFWQLPLEQQSRGCTAFTCPGKGQFQYNVLSMGLKGGPGSFQRMMELAMINLPDVIVYIDDLLLHTKTHQQHREGLQRVFNRLRNVNIKLNPDKCKFGAVNVSYLGFRLTPNGILPGTDKLKAVKEMPPPSSITQVRQFLGLCNFFRTHVQNFSSIAAPLNRLTSKKSGWSGGRLPPDALAAFYSLQKALISNPVVAYPRPDKPFSLIVDAATGGTDTKGGFGAILCQPSETGELQVVAYASRSLKDHERNYTPYLAEMNAAAWAIDHFDVYLRGRRFTLYTDHKPLETMKTIHQKTMNRLMERLNMYDFDLQYKKGAEMPADILSRCPLEVNAATFEDSLRQDVAEDEFCQELKSFVQGTRTPMDGNKLRVLKKIAPFMVEEHGLLYLTENERKVLILPRVRVSEVVSQAHGTLLTGHGSIDKTLARLRTQYYWPFMRLDVQQAILECDRCQRAFKRGHSLSKLHPLPLCTGTNQRVHCDLFGPLKTITSKAHVLCITDAHTKFVELVIVPNKEAETVGRAIFNQWICRYGIPHQILTDGGKEFCNKLFHTLCEFLMIDKQKTTPAHPQCNAQAEVVNKSIKKYLAVMTENSLEWEDLIPALAFSYNTTQHRTTGMTPAELMLGYLPRSMLGKDIPQYSEDPIMDTLRAFHTARAIANKEALRQTEVYRSDHDKRVTEEIRYSPGQFVLLDRRLFVNENEKLSDKWEGPYVIQKVLANGVADILRKGRTLRINIHRLKPYQALSEIRPNYVLPEYTNGSLDDMSGERDTLFIKSDPREAETSTQRSVTPNEQQEAEIIVKTAGTSEFPTSFQETKFGRHPMVLRKRQNLKIISAITEKPESVNAVNTQVISAHVRNINLLADFTILDEFGLPLQVKNQTQAQWIRRRRRYLKSLSPAQRNALLTGDPGFVFDPIVYEYVWSTRRPPLSPKLLAYFGHLPGIKELKGGSPPPIKTEPPDVEMKQEKDQSLFEEEHPSKWQPKPDPMVEDNTFYDARSSHSSPSKDIPKAPRHQEEYVNPWKAPWNYPPIARRALPAPRIQREQPYSLTTSLRSLPDSRALRHSSSTERMERSASLSNPFGEPSTTRDNVIRPAVMNPNQRGTTTSGNFLTPGDIYRPTVHFGRPAAGITGSANRGAFAPSATPGTWYQAPMQTQSPNLPSISYQGASPSQSLTPPPGSIPIMSWSSTFAPSDGRPPSESSQSIQMGTNFGVNSLEHGPPPLRAKGLGTNSSDYSIPRRAMECRRTTASPVSSEKSSTPLTTQTADSDSEPTTSSIPVLSTSRWTQTTSTGRSTNVSSTTRNRFGSQEPLLIPFRKDQNRYGMPVQWIRTNGPTNWELQQIGEPISLEPSQWRPSTQPQTKRSLDQISPDSSTSCSCVPRRKQRSKTWKGSRYHELSTAYGPTPSPSTSTCRNCSTCNTTTTSGSTNAGWPSWLNDTQGKWQTTWQDSTPSNNPPPQNRSLPLAPLPSYGSYVNGGFASNEWTNKVPRLTTADHLLAFMGDNRRLQMVHLQRLQQLQEQERQPRGPACLVPSTL